MEPSFKVVFGEKSTRGFREQCTGSKKNAAALRNTPDALSKLYLSKFFIFSTSGTIPTGINSDFTMLIFHPETTSKHSTHFKYLSCSRHSHPKKKKKSKYCTKIRGEKPSTDHMFYFPLWNQQDAVLNFTRYCLVTALTDNLLSASISIINNNCDNGSP